jgi:hypothetical protein
VEEKNEETNCLFLQKRVLTMRASKTAFVTGVTFAGQVIIEIIGARKPGFEWVLPATGVVFAASLLWVLWVGYREKNK